MFLLLSFSAYVLWRETKWSLKFGIWHERRSMFSSQESIMHDFKDISQFFWTELSLRGKPVLGGLSKVNHPPEIRLSWWIYVVPYKFTGTHYNHNYFDHHFEIIECHAVNRSIISSHPWILLANENSWGRHRHRFRAYLHITSGLRKVFVGLEILYTW